MEKGSALNDKMVIKFSIGFKKYSSNTTYLILEKVARIFYMLTIWTYVVRYLGPEQFGILSYATSFIFLFSIFSDLGLELIVVRELIKNGGRSDEILGSTFLLKFLGALCAVIIIFFITKIYCLDPCLRKIILIMSLSMIFQSFDGINYYFQSCVLSKYKVFPQLVSLAAISILSLWFIWLKKPLVYFVYIIFVEAVISGLILVIFYTLRHQWIFRWKINFDITKKLFNDSWPIILLGFATSLYMRFDQMIIKEMLGVVAVGYYSVAVRLSEAFYFVPMILTSSLFPAIVNAKLKDEQIYHDRLQALFGLLFWLAFSISLLTTLIARPAVEMFYGPQYLPAADILVIHTWGGIFAFWGVAVCRWAISENLQIYMMYYGWVGVLSSIVLNRILIGWYGIRGAAIATILSYCVTVVLANLLSPKTRKVILLQFRCFNIVRLIKGIMAIIGHHSFPFGKTDQFNEQRN